MLPDGGMAFTLTSSAFDDGEIIPVQYTCDGDNRVPPLAWHGAPEGTRSFAVIVDDPDAPGGTFTHWLVYDIPGTSDSIAGEPPGVQTLTNDFGHQRYGGPCPPPRHGPHRYYFRVYAVDVPALQLHGKTRDALERALRAHTLGTAQLMGRYERRAR